MCGLETDRLSARAASSRRLETATRLRICVVEDDDRVRRVLRHIFEAAGYAVSEAASEAELLAILKSQKIALVTLDLTLRNEYGLSIARHVRSFSDVPIIMVTARGEDIDRIVGLEIGADDYIAKPFNGREVVARARAVLRRTQQRQSVAADAADEIRFGKWVFDMSGHELRTLNGQVCRLTSAEFKLLEAFVRHPGRVLSRDFLIDAIGGVNAEPLERSIDTTVSRLRRKIESDGSTPALVKTVRGAGYRFTGSVRS
jgi:DNA-binding response OmpR family regulator